MTKYLEEHEQETNKKMYIIHTYMYIADNTQTCDPSLPGLSALHQNIRKSCSACWKQKTKYRLNTHQSFNTLRVPVIVFFFDEWDVSNHFVFMLFCSYKFHPIN